MACYLGNTIDQQRKNRMISDGAHNFAEATISVFWNRNLPRNEQTKHIREITLDDERHNNKMESYGKFRDHDSIMRGAKSADSPIFKGAHSKASSLTG
jgi:hypothetical protein